jgi:hypothetical protein
MDCPVTDYEYWQQRRQHHFKKGEFEAALACCRALFDCARKDVIVHGQNCFEVPQLMRETLLEQFEYLRDEKNELFDEDFFSKTCSCLLNKIRIEDCPSMTENVLRMSEKEFNEQKLDQLLIYDDFLTEKALKSLQSFLFGSTIFSAFSEGGFVGSYSYLGFSCPLLYQIVTEMQKKIAFLHNLKLLEMWVYKYAWSGEGVKLHSGLGKVTLNLWLTSESFLIGLKIDLIDFDFILWLFSF